MVFESAWLTSLVLLLHASTPSHWPNCVPQSFPRSVTVWRMVCWRLPASATYQTCSTPTRKTTSGRPGHSVAQTRVNGWTCATTGAAAHPPIVYALTLFLSSQVCCFSLRVLVCVVGNGLGTVARVCLFVGASPRECAESPYRVSLLRCAFHPSGDIAYVAEVPWNISEMLQWFVLAA